MGLQSDTTEGLNITHCSRRESLQVTQLFRGTREATWRKDEQGLSRERKLEKLQKSRCRIVQLGMILCQLTSAY